MSHVLQSDAPQTEAAGDTTGVRVLQRVVFPAQGNLDVVPLYVETNMDRGSSMVGGADDNFDVEQDDAQTNVASATPGEAQSSVRFGSEANGTGDLAGRRSGVIAAGRRVSFGSYFNAFPASYWKRWTTVEQVVLRIRVKGACSIIVYRSTAKGKSHPVEDIQVTMSSGVQTVEVPLPLTQFIDGGWYWFDIAAASNSVTLVEADWATVTDRTEHGRFSIAITTFNRTDYCVDGLRVLANAPDVLAVLDNVFVADQGSERVVEHPEFAEATAGLGDKLKIIEQGNLGGSGGFSRGMDETVLAGRSDYVLVLDDDVVTEPESMLRAITFADLARKPTIVGGHMFSMYDRSVLHAFGETIAKYNWWWGAAPRTRTEHDFGRRNLRNTPWLHRRIDVDYNGWWMCLIPTAVVRDLGLALPVFIKWDDAEYGLRARDAGVPVVSMPGVAVWHVPWQDKNDALDWQAYYHLRNRLVAALLHSPYPRGGSVVSENFEYQVRHLLSMQYSTARLRLMAIEDILSGPQHLHDDLLTQMGKLRDVRKQFTDARGEKDLDAFPTVRRLKPPKRGKEPTSPSSKVGLVVRATLGAVRQALPVSEHAKKHPEALIPSQDAEWWALSNVDGALVSSADGTTTSWYRRDPQQFRELMQDSVRLHAQLAREWPRLRRLYLDEMPNFTSPERWRATFAESIEQRS